MSLWKSTVKKPCAIYKLYEEEVTNFLLKAGLLGYRSRVCDYCKEGNVPVKKILFIGSVADERV